ncbi:hypothetical protein E2L08_04385 [Palleronia sediminis]|uniref:DUF3303 domain-containing protein n=1 Tax=Palleronia sediminis TaxID=2547833 RepID=A0A4R6AJI6_9RHOB|nr:hypothetical protein [Palleronia sediminis]TDL81896.1 hypothetical protein E2L08_04385 [Palleronia sediminis]
MQLLLRFDTDDRAAFRTAYDASREDRDQAGLTQLQLWEETDAPDRVWALFAVTDRDRAAAWLAREGALDRHVAAMQAHFLATA